MTSKNILFLSLLLWVCSALGQGEIAQHQLSKINELRQRVMAEKIAHNATNVNTCQYRWSSLMLRNDRVLSRMLDQIERNNLLYSFDSAAYQFSNSSGEAFYISDVNWISVFGEYVTELRRQEEFKKEYLTAMDKLLSKAITANSIRTSLIWHQDTQLTLTYDNVSETFMPNSNDIATTLESIGENPEIRSLNLSGCKIQTCFDVLISMLKQRNDFEVIILANCDLSSASAQRLLEAVSQNSQLQVIDVSGNKIPYETMYAFQSIVQLNHWRSFCHKLETNAAYIDPIDLHAAVTNPLTNDHILSIVAHVTIEANLLRIIASHHEARRDTLLAVAQNPVTDSITLDNIITGPHTDLTVLTAVAANPNTTANQLLAVIRNPLVNIQEVRPIIAQHPNVNEGLRREVVLYDVHPSVQMTKAEDQVGSIMSLGSSLVGTDSYVSTAFPYLRRNPNEALPKFGFEATPTEKSHDHSSLEVNLGYWGSENLYSNVSHIFNKSLTQGFEKRELLHEVHQHNANIIEPSSWYDDDKVNTLLKHYLDESLGDGRMDAINLGQREGETLAANLKDRQEQLEQLKRLTGLRIPTIILPVNLGGFNSGAIERGSAGNHWAALFIHRPNATSENPNPNTILAYVDPLGGSIPKELYQILQNQYPEAEIVNPCMRFQYDGYNCGPWVVEILRYLVSTHGMELPPETFDINAAREEHQSILQQHAQQPTLPSILISNEPLENLTNVKSIKSLIRRLGRTIDDGLRISCDMICDENLRQSFKQFLNDFKNKIENMTRLMNHADTTDMFIPMAINHLKVSRREFEEYKQKFNVQLHNYRDKELDCMTIELILTEIDNHYTFPFQPKLEELRQKVLEEELMYALASIPRLSQRPACFISYAWGHYSHVKWIHNFDRHLRGAGIHVHLDIRDNLHTPLDAFMSYINVDDYVIVIGTPELRKKYENSVANGGGAVVRTEMSMVQDRFTSNVRAIIKVLLAGVHRDLRDNSGRITMLGSFPPVIGGGVAGIDFTNPAIYYKNLFDIIKIIFERSPIEMTSRIVEIRQGFMERKKEIAAARTLEDIQRVATAWSKRRDQNPVKILSLER